MLGEGKIIKFEVSYLSDEAKRIYDIAYDTFNELGEKVTVNLELKSWSGFWPDSLKTQFVKDLENMSELGSHLWIFNKRGINQDIDKLRENVLKALRKSDGTPIDELVTLFEKDEIVEKFKSFLENDDIVSVDQFLEELNKPEIFIKFFKIVE